MPRNDLILTLEEARQLRRGLGPVLRAARILEKAGHPAHLVLPMGGAPRLVGYVPAADAGGDWSGTIVPGMTSGGILPVLSVEDLELAVGTAREAVDVGPTLIEEEIPAGPSDAAGGLDRGAGDGGPAVAPAPLEGPENGAWDAPTPAAVTGAAGTDEGVLVGGVGRDAPLPGAAVAADLGGGAVVELRDATPAAPPAAPPAEPPVELVQRGTSWTQAEDERLLRLVVEGVVERGLSKSAAARAAAVRLGRGAPGVDFRLRKVLPDLLEAAMARALAEKSPVPDAGSGVVPAEEVAPGCDAERAAAPAAVVSRPAAAPAAVVSRPAPRPAVIAPPIEDCPTPNSRALRARLNACGYGDGWSAALDLAMFEALGRGDKLPMIALDLGCDAAVLKVRVQLLNAQASEVCGCEGVTLESQRLLVDELRARAAWFRARGVA